MNAEELLRHYDKVADSPDAVGRMRRFVLELAVRGKLVPQDPTDEPARDLLARMATERARGVAAGEFRPSKAQEVDASNPPFELPESWVWAALGRVFVYDAGAKCDPSALDPQLLLVELEDVEKDTGRLRTRLRVRDRESQSTKSEFRPGDVLYGKLRPYLNKVLVADEPGYSTTEIVALRPYIPLCSAYCALALRRPDFVEYVTRVGQGTKMPRLRYEDAVIAPFPIPPLAEQHRIVAKVDELMALCDRLEAARAAREAARDRLTAASLARLNTPDPETFADDAHFALDALPALTARTEQIARVRKTILRLAMRGKLSPHHRWSDKPVRLGTVATLQNGYAFKSEWFAKTGTKLLRNANVSHGVLDWSDTVYLDEERAVDYERFRLQEGDIVLSLDRPFITTGTKVAPVAASDLPALLLQRVGRFVINGSLEPEFLLLWINSPDFAEQIDPGRSNGVPHISSKQVEAAEIFLPPREEQIRLIAKVNSLMAACESLEASLSSGESQRRRFLEALIREALEPEDELEIAE